MPELLRRLILSAALLLAGCGLSAIFKDDRIFDVYAFISVSLIGSLFEAASAGSLTGFIIGAFLELNLIFSNLDDICANLDN